MRRAHETSLGNPADAGAGGGQLRLDFLIAAIDVIDAVDDGFAVGGEAGQHQGRAGAEIAER